MANNDTVALTPADAEDAIYERAGLAYMTKIPVDWHIRKIKALANAKEEKLITEITTVMDGEGKAHREVKSRVIRLVTAGALKARSEAVALVADIFGLTGNKKVDNRFSGSVQVDHRLKDGWPERPRTIADWEKQSREAREARRLQEGDIIDL